MSARKRDILRRLVAALKQADGEPMELAQIQVRLEGQFVPRPTRGEIEEALFYAQDACFVRGTTTDEDVQIWAITGKGKLAEL